MADFQDWLAFAKDDLRNANILKNQKSTLGACFHAQQAAEKSLKALILLRREKIPKVHSLGFLIEKLALPELKDAGKFLGRFYAESRYPDASPGGYMEKVPSVEETEQALGHATKILDFVSLEIAATETNQRGNTLSSSKGNILILVLVGILLLGAVSAGAYYLGKRSVGTKAPTATGTGQQTTPTISTRQGPNQSLIALEKLTLNIPDGWWSKYYDDGKNGKWTNINPQALPEPSDAVPAFTVYYRKSTTVDQQKMELIDNWGFSDRKEEILKINGVTVYTLEGVSKPGFLESKRMKIAFIPKGSDLYYLFDTGILEKHETYFDQILSTFKLTQ